MSTVSTIVGFALNMLGIALELLLTFYAGTCTPDSLQKPKSFIATVPQAHTHTIAIVALNDLL
jgi:hypothetical protein